MKVDDRSTDGDDLAAKVTVVRCIERILSTLEQSPDGMTQEEIVSACGSDEDVVLGVLWAVQRSGFVTPEAERRYRLNAPTRRKS